MNRTKPKLLVGVIGILVGALGASVSFAASVTPELQQAQALFKALPGDMGTAEFPITPARVALGRALFFDPRPSLDGTVSCARCHQPSLYGTDALSTSIGVKGRAIPRN